MRTTVVNLLTVDGVRYLVAPRGETQWVRNLRADGGTGTLRVGRRTEAVRRRRAGRRRQGADHPGLPEGLGVGGRPVLRRPRQADSPDADIAAVAAGFPVFRIG